MHNTESFLVNRDNTESSLVTTDNTESFLVTMQNTESFLVTMDNTESFLVTMHSTESLGWLADVFPRCDEYRSLPSPALCFPDFHDSGHPPSPIGVFPPQNPENLESGSRGAAQNSMRKETRNNRWLDNLRIFNRKRQLSEMRLPTGACMIT